MNFFIASTQSEKERKGKERKKGKENKRKKSNFKSNNAELRYMRHPKRKRMSR
jgi:hypothetical protein